DEVSLNELYLEGTWPEDVRWLGPGFQYGTVLAVTKPPAPIRVGEYRVIGVLGPGNLRAGPFNSPADVLECTLAGLKSIASNSPGKALTWTVDELADGRLFLIRFQPPKPTI
ncbi:MAG: hypothetical protein M1608_16545, partial [Candidatus Omnitrophica bacterium]|nr:hypothetical protein [Candidatus Omnitrophota bacterium]